MNGIIIINKPKDITSNNVVNKVKHILNTKVGHTGTLDPNATGVLPLLLGDGTKFSKYLINHDKKYRGTLKLGIKTSTADVEGEIVEEKDVNEEIFSDEYIEKVLASFIGKQVQTPPVYSAIKVNGKKLYDYARKGIDVEVPSREIEIYGMELIGFNRDERTIVFDVECSKGTYIRSLCEDIAKKLYTVGYMLDLARLRVGEFEISQSVTIEDLEKHSEDNEWISNHIITLEDVMKDYPRIDIPVNKLNLFLNGVKLDVNKAKQDSVDGVYKVYCDNIFLGSGTCFDGRIKRDIILNNG